MWPGTPLYDEAQAGSFTPLSPAEEVLEQRLLLENLTVQGCVFVATHMSNSLPLSGRLQEDKEEMMDKMDEFICNMDLSSLQKRPIAPEKGW
jgi:hypothetical protein